MVNNYVIKYAVLKVNERGSDTTNFVDPIRGYIVSKCYLVETDVFSRFDGYNKVVYKVVFPYRNYRDFKLFTDNKIKYNYNEKAAIPIKDSNDEYINLSIVDNVYDSYDDAKSEANKCNDELLFHLMDNIKIDNPKFKYIFDYRYNEFREHLVMCYKFEFFINKQTENLSVTKTENVKKLCLYPNSK